MCSHVMVNFTYISISSLVGRRECLSTRLLILMYVKLHTVTAYTTVFLKMNPRARNM
jgi:hypothetical protein